MGVHRVWKRYEDFFERWSSRSEGVSEVERIMEGRKFEDVVVGGNLSRLVVKIHRTF